MACYCYSVHLDARWQMKVLASGSTEVVCIEMKFDESWSGVGAGKHQFSAVFPVVESLASVGQGHRCKMVAVCSGEDVDDAGHAQEAEHSMDYRL